MRRFLGRIFVRCIFIVWMINCNLAGCCLIKRCILTRPFWGSSLPAAPLPWGGLRFNCGASLSVAEKPYHGYKIAIDYALRKINNMAMKCSPRVTLCVRADCQASATPKNASKGERHPKHFLGLRLIDKTIFCNVSLSKE